MYMQYVGIVSIHNCTFHHLASKREDCFAQKQERMDGAQNSDLVKTESNYDRMKELQAFDDTKAGVKGLVDSGISKIPRMFIRPSQELSDELNHNHPPSDIELPVIDLDGLYRSADQRSKIVDKLKIASENWGFFQVINHGILTSVLDNMINGVHRFNEQDQEVKKQYYTRDMAKKVRYNSTFDLYKLRTANWRDTLGISAFGQFNPTELPVACREASMEYIKNIMKLGNTLLELLSEALGLKPDHLRNMECANGCHISCHYYPACPEPEVTLGATKHSDPGFLTILLQNHIDGLQVLYEDQWVNVHPIPGGLVVNIGDLLQLISNAKFKSNVHRVISNRVGPRISVAYFLSGPLTNAKLYRPIEELISEENPPLYSEVILNEYFGKFSSRGLDEKATIEDYKL